jgi:gluconokinase
MNATNTGCILVFIRDILRRAVTMVNPVDHRSMNRNLYVVMGITGSGKTTVGAMLAHTLGVDFVEGDDYHTPANVQRMASGIPLTDDDRAGWLQALATRIGEAKDSGTGLVVTCSALKRSYRDILRTRAPELQFIFLNGPRALITERIAGRRGHFMPVSLLESQVATLEQPALDEHAWAFDVEEPAEKIVTDIMTRASE